jgi:hypothetical protein
MRPHLRAHAVVHAVRRVERVELDRDLVGLRDRLERFEPSGECVRRELVADQGERAGSVEGHEAMLTATFFHRYAAARSIVLFHGMISMNTTHEITAASA